MLSITPSGLLNSFLTSLCWTLIQISASGCGDTGGDRETPAQYRNTPPQYNLANIEQTKDTLTFHLDEDTYTSIKSFNLFVHNGDDFFCFYDERSGSINIYNFHSQQLVKKIELKDHIKKSGLYKATTFVVCMDSIFVANNKRIILLDSSGKVRKSIKFLDKPRYAWANFKNTAPGILKGKHLYAAIRPYVDDESKKALRQWKVLYEFNLDDSTTNQHYHLPIALQKNLYGHRFLDFSYCLNDRGNFVFSFPADSSIYESDLYECHIAYNGKSQFQTAAIQPLSVRQISDDATKQFLMRDSYGAIYFNPIHRNYFRVVYSGITEKDYNAKKRQREQRLIILDQQLRIIGESSLKKDLLLNSLIITRDGQIYVRVKPADEYAIHFIRLNYNKINNAPVQITKK